jgi:menaquinone-9 beta-reductase
MLEPIFKACEKDPEARRTLLEAFTGDAPVYGLLKHPRMLARALQESVTERIRS